MTDKKDTKKILKYIEFHIVDRCNLNCNACSHLSPLVKTDFDHFDSFKHDITVLKAMFDCIEDIHLLGGEPFLDERLADYLLLVRKTCPESRIEITTNGLLIPSVDEKLLAVISENSIELNISLYPPTEKVLSKIEQRLNHNNIHYKVSDPITAFRKKLQLNGENDPADSYKKCTVGKNCTFAYNGDIYLCSGAALIHYFNDYFGTDIRCNDASIHLDDPETDADRILSFISHHNDSCRYCGPVNEETWSICKDMNAIDISHWIVG